MNAPISSTIQTATSSGDGRRRLRLNGLRVGAVMAAHHVTPSPLDEKAETAVGADDSAASKAFRASAGRAYPIPPQ